MTALGNVRSIAAETSNGAPWGSFFLKNRKMVFGSLKIFSKSLNVDNDEIY
jgi:hypothetical protein